MPEEASRRSSLQDRPTSPVDVTAIPQRSMPAEIQRRYQVPRPHPSTIVRWMSRGVKGRRLVSFCLGGRRYFRPEDLDAFMRACNELAAAAD